MTQWQLPRWLVVHACLHPCPTLCTHGDDTGCRRMYMQCMYHACAMQSGTAAIMPGSTVHRQWRLVTRASSRVCTQLQQVPPQRPTRARAWHACACVARRFSMVNQSDPLRGCGRIRMIRRIGCEANGRTDVIQHQQAPADSAGDSCSAFDEQEPVPRTRGCSPRPLSCAEMDVLGAVRASVIHRRPDCLFAPQCRPLTIWGAVLRRCRDAV